MQLVATIVKVHRLVGLPEGQGDFQPGHHFGHPFLHCFWVGQAIGQMLGATIAAVDEVDKAAVADLVKSGSHFRPHCRVTEEVALVDHAQLGPLGGTGQGGQRRPAFHNGIFMAQH